MPQIGNCKSKCSTWIGIGRHMNWDIYNYCKCCRKIFPKEKTIKSKFCPCCGEWARRSPSTSAKNQKKRRANA